MSDWKNFMRVARNYCCSSGKYIDTLDKNLMTINLLSTKLI
jgi:hypothetical protein